MANYDNQSTRYGTPAVGRAAERIDEGLRAHMLRVYNYMVSGLVLTGLFAYGAYALATTTDPSAAAGQLANGVYLTSLGVTLYTSGVMWVLFLGTIGLVFFLSFRIGKMSVSAAQTTFWIYAALLGVALSSIFITYTAASITQV